MGKKVETRISVTFSTSLASRVLLLFFSPVVMSDRFYCPWPGCKRSFAELWRLKVHHRSSASSRGSGVERGHGVEVEHCPRCQAPLLPGRHHVGCSAGPVAPRQAAKRMQVGKKTGEEEAWEGVRTGAERMMGP